ncbi:MAG: MMPL family transporter [Conexibacter sp.]
MRTLAKVVIGRPRAVIVAWILLCGICSLFAFTLFDKVLNVGFAVPGSDSARTSTIYRRSILGHDGTQLFAVVTNLPPKLNAANDGPRIVRRALSNQLDIGAIKYENLTKGGVIVEIRLHLDVAHAEQRVPAIRAALGRVRPSSVRISLAGAPAVSDRYTTIARHDLAVAEKLAFPLTFCVLLIAFQAFVAALLPILLAAATMLVTFTSLAIIGDHVALNVFVVNTASILALGLSIDFSLFLVTRFRQELVHATSVEEALTVTMTTTGRAIVLSTITIAASVTGLFVVGVGLFSSMAIGATAATLVAAAAALTLLPAVMCLLGHRIDALRLKRVARAAGRGTLWDGISRAVTRRPVIGVVASLAVLVILAVPATSISLGFSTLRALPRNEPVREATERVGSPITVVTKDKTDRIVRLINAEVGQIWDPRRGSDGWMSLHAVIDGDPDGRAARGSVERLRTAVKTQRVPPTHVGGASAAIVDLSGRIVDRTPYVVLVTCILGFVVFAIGLRSIVIPAKAVVSTLLSTVATLGVLARLFADGSSSPQLDFFVPLFLFAILFGLSTDYEIFLLSRIREAVADGQDTRNAVRRGLFASGRAITLAGLTLVTVFLAFATSSLKPLQQLGVGLALAVVIDITIVRCVLVPASVVLLRRWNWWFPGTGGQVAWRTGRR